MGIDRAGAILVVALLLATGGGGLSNADDVPNHWVYLPLVVKNFDPAATPAPTPTCGLLIRNDTGDELHYMVSDTDIGWRLCAGVHRLCSYGYFPAGMHTWYADSRECGRASGTQLFPAPEVYPNTFSALHTFTCVKGLLLVGTLSPYP